MALQNNILELHSEEWSRRCLWYMSDCERHKRGHQSLNLNPVEYDDAPPLHSLPTCKWFLACYVKDVWDRLPLLKASMTSIYGEILKIDSTKKVRLKLRESAIPTGDEISSSNKTVIVFFSLKNLVF